MRAYLAQGHAMFDLAMSWMGCAMTSTDQREVRRPSDEIWRWERWRDSLTSAMRSVSVCPCC